MSATRPPSIIRQAWLSARFWAAIAVVAALVAPAGSQTSQTGFPPFSSQSGDRWGAVNLGNLNAHHSLPISHKGGRGLGVDLTLGYDTTIYSVLTLPCSSPVSPPGCTTSSFALGSGGLSNILPFAVTGYLYSVAGFCKQDPNASNLIDIGFLDPMGTLHSLPSSVVISSDPACGQSQFSGFASDQSGYSFSINLNGASFVQAPNGTTYQTVFQTGSSQMTVTDRNGNQISAPGAGALVITDTLGLSALTGNATLDSFINITSETYTYPTSNNGTATATLNWKVYRAQQTAFGCPNVGDYLNLGFFINGQQEGITLPDNLVLADGSKYTFSYEPTPANVAIFPNSVTGRLASITLPTGGTISYSYSGPNAGINCNDGTTMNMTRTTPDGISTYSRSVSGTTSTTTVTDPQGNQTVVTFQNGVETQRQIYQGSSTTGTLLETIATCYNGNKTSCSSTAVTLPINETSAFVQLPNGQQRERDTFVNTTTGLATEIDEYDFGTNQPGSLLRKTLISYATNLNNNILDLPAKETVCAPGGNDSDCGGSGTKFAQTTFGYDETALKASGATQLVSISGSRGNLTSIHQWLKGATTTLNTVNTFDDAGNILTTTDPNGNETSFTYQCDDAFINQTTLPSTGVAHKASTAYDCNTGLLSSFSDQNGNQTAFFYDDMHRPTEIDYPDGGQTNWGYPDPNHVTMQQKINGSDSTSYTTVLDSYGRTQETQRATPDCSTSIKIDTTYDSLGRLASRTNPYCKTSDPTYGVTSFQYDALGRTAQVTNPDTSTTLAAYTGRAAQTQDEGNGGSRITRIAQTDGLGRLVSLCEVTGATQSGNNKPSACNLDIGGTVTGFLTTYTYDVLGDLTGVQQGAVSRSFSYDSLARLLSETHPESGTTSYTYDSNGNLLTRVRPAPNQGNPATTLKTTYTYDALNRPTQKSYSDGKTPTVNFLYDTPSGWGNPTVTQSNLVGRLSEAYLGSFPQGNIVFGYDAMGRIVANNQCTPLNCGTANWPLSYQYDLIGDVTTATNGVGVTFSYTYDSAARLSSMTSSLADNNHPGTLYSNLQYNSLGEIAATSLGTTLNEIFKWDCRGRILGYASAPQPAAPTLSLSNTSGCPNTSAMNFTPSPPGHPREIARAVSFSKPYPFGTSILLTRSKTDGNGEAGVIRVTLLSFDVNRSSRDITTSYRQGESVLDIAQHLAKEINDANLYRIRARVRQVGSDARLELTSQTNALLPRITALVSVSSNQASPSISATVLPIRRPLVLLGRLASRQMEAK